MCLVETVTVVGIGADGWAGLAEPGRAAVRTAEVVLGGPRQLDLVAGHTKADARPWPSPMLPALPGLFAELADRRVCVLASGDPLFHGIGATLARVLGPERLHVLPHPSSVSLACARMGWPVDAVEVVSTVARPLARVRRVLASDARVLVLSEDAGTPAALAALLTDAGYGGSAMTVLARLGGPDERRVDGTAAPGAVGGTAGCWSGTASPRGAVVPVVGVMHMRPDTTDKTIARTRPATEKSSAAGRRGGGTGRRRGAGLIDAAPGAWAR